MEELEGWSILVMKTYPHLKQNCACVCVFIEKEKNCDKI